MQGEIAAGGGKLPKQELFGPALKGLVAAFGGDVVLKFLGLAATFITLRELGPFEYGLWQLLLSIATAFGVITVPAVAHMLVAEISREYGAGRTERGNAIAIRACALLVVLSSVGALAMTFIAPFIRSLSGINIEHTAQILALSVFAVGLRQVYQVTFHGRLWFFHAQAMKVVDRLSYLAGVALFVWYFERGIDGMVYAYVISSFTSVILFAPLMFGILRAIAARQERGAWRPFVESVWERGRWAVAGDIPNALVGSLWPWVVGFFLGVPAVGTISVAILILGQVAAFVPIAYVLRSILPRTAETPDRLKEWLYRSMKFSLWGHVAAGILAAGACAILFPLFFPEHLAALILFAALLPSLPLRGVATAATEWFNATRQQRALFFVSSVPKLVMFALLPLFLWQGGIIGYALWYLVNADVILYVRFRAITKTLGKIPLSFFFHFDRVDVELISRSVALTVGRAMRLVGR